MRIVPISICQFFTSHFFVQGDNPVNQRFRAGRTSGNINIHRHNLIHPLHDGVVIEDATAGGTVAHRDHPFWIRHLVIQVA